jgi:hypothetical protein
MKTPQVKELKRLSGHALVTQPPKQAASVSAPAPTR